MSERVIPKSAVVIIETADSFVLERRPDLPGKLAYPKMMQFFGGGREEGEDGPTAAARELFEEVSLSISSDALDEHWVGEYEGKGKNGEPVTRHVSVYRLCLTALGRESLSLQVQGEIADVPKTAEALIQRKSEFTPFAFETLWELIEKENQHVSTN